MQPVGNIVVEPNSDENSNGKKQKPIKFRENKALYLKLKFFSFLRLIWNNKEKQFLMRDFYSWANLGLFYFIYYVLLGFYFWIMFAIFMAIANANTQRPRYVKFESPLADYDLLSPGMGIRPHVGPIAPAISFNVNGDGIDEYYQNLDLFLRDYANKNPSAVECNSTTSSPKNCRFDFNRYLKQLDCSQSNKYGFADGKPCVIVKINNIIDWEPGKVVIPPREWYQTSRCDVTNASALFNVDSTKYAFITCIGESSADQAKINSITFNSPLGNNTCLGGIPFYYYPYDNSEFYMQPFAVLKLDLNFNTQVSIKCSSWAEKISLDQKTGLGFVKFTITVKK